MGTCKMQTISPCHGVVSSGSESPWTMEQILISKDKREMCYYIQTKGRKCKLSSCFLKEGLTDEEGI